MSEWTQEAVKYVEGVLQDVSSWLEEMRKSPVLTYRESNTLVACLDQLDLGLDALNNEECGLNKEVVQAEQREQELRQIVEGLLLLAPDSVARQKLFRRYRKLDEEESDRPKLTIVPTNEGVTHGNNNNH